jgi:hypothetical protein
MTTARNLLKTLVSCSAYQPNRPEWSTRYGEHERRYAEELERLGMVNKVKGDAYPKTFLSNTPAYQRTRYGEMLVDQFAESIRESREYIRKTHKLKKEDIEA